MVDVELVFHHVLGRHRRICRQEHERSSQWLANLDTGLGARGTSERRQSTRDGHRCLERDVAALRLSERPVSQMNGVAVTDIEQFRVETLGDERTERSEEQGQALEYLEQRRLRRQ